MNRSRVDKRLRTALEEKNTHRDEAIATCIESAYDDQTFTKLERFLNEAGIEIRHKLKLATAFSVKTSLQQVELLADQDFVKQIRAAQPQNNSPNDTG